MSWYKDVYLKSEDWENFRSAMLHDRDYRCEACGSQNKLDVHHGRYRKIWDVVPRDLIVLCRECHNFVHSKIKNVENKWAASRLIKCYIKGSRHPNLIAGMKALGIDI